MIQIIQADGRAEQARIAAMRARAAEVGADIEEAVSAVMGAVKEKGLSAVEAYSLKFDGKIPYENPREELEAAYDRCPDELIAAMERIRWWDWSHDMLRERLRDFDDAAAFCRKFDPQ